MVATVRSVNVGQPQPNPYKTARDTGIGKTPQPHGVAVRAPGSKAGGLGSGLAGDFIGDRRHHGGDEQAVYAFAREDLDRWQQRLGRDLPAGFFGENLTTYGVDVTESLIGERWLIGSEVELQVTVPRLPCATFRGWMQERGWLKTFTADGRPGAYLSVVRPGVLHAGDPVTIVHRPAHHVSIGLVFRALTSEPALLPQLAAAGDDMPAGLRRTLHRSNAPS